MTRYNPCGRIVDFGRKPYRTACRFLRDSEIVSTVRWYEAAPNAPTLGKTCIISRREWESDEGILDAPVGEVSGAPKTFLAGFVPVGLPGEHVCGTDEEFDNGGTLAPDLPPVEYDANGWPRCCGGPRRVSGGGGGSGRATLVIVYTPTPGLTCCTAPILTVGRTYAGTITTLLTPQAFAFTTVPGTQYHLEIGPFPLIFADGIVNDGPDCLGVTIVPGTITPAPCLQWVARDVFTCLVFNGVAGTGPYTFRLAEGPC